MDLDARVRHICGNLLLTLFEPVLPLPVAADRVVERQEKPDRRILRRDPVDPVREITELIEAQRGYELNSKVITAADQMLGATTQIR